MYSYATVLSVSSWSEQLVDGYLPKSTSCRKQLTLNTRRQWLTRTGERWMVGNRFCWRRSCSQRWLKSHLVRSFVVYGRHGTRPLVENPPRNIVAGRPGATGRINYVVAMDTDWPPERVLKWPAFLGYGDGREADQPTWRCIKRQRRRIIGDRTETARNGGRRRKGKR